MAILNYWIVLGCLRKTLRHLSAQLSAGLAALRPRCGTNGGSRGGSCWGTVPRRSPTALEGPAGPTSRDMGIGPLQVLYRGTRTWFGAAGVSSSWWGICGTAPAPSQGFHKIMTRNSLSHEKIIHTWKQLIYNLSHLMFLRIWFLSSKNYNVIWVSVHVISSNLLSP